MINQQQRKGRIFCFWTLINKRSQNDDNKCIFMMKGSTRLVQEKQEIIRIAQKMKYWQYVNYIRYQKIHQKDNISQGGFFFVAIGILVLLLMITTNIIITNIIIMTLFLSNQNQKPFNLISPVWYIMKLSLTYIMYIG